MKATELFRERGAELPITTTSSGGPGGYNQGPQTSWPLIHRLDLKAKAFISQTKGNLLPNFVAESRLVVFEFFFLN